MSEKDIVEEAWELLANATPEPWRAVAYIGKEPRHVTAGQFTEQTPIADAGNPNGLVAYADLPQNARLIARAPELLRTLANEVDKLRKLVVHMHVHSGYPKNGYMQMTTEQKALYDQTWERSVAELDAEEASHAKP